ncbi:MAG: hypothetical protein LBQ46_06680 [Treponema sp.]|nr:hypothetical protein [Treponema sp.]
MKTYQPFLLFVASPLLPLRAAQAGGQSSGDDGIRLYRSPGEIAAP